MVWLFRGTSKRILDFSGHALMILKSESEFQARIHCDGYLAGQTTRDLESIILMKLTRKEPSRHCSSDESLHGMPRSGGMPIFCGEWWLHCEKPWFALDMNHIFMSFRIFISRWIHRFMRWKYGFINMLGSYSQTHKFISNPTFSSPISTQDPTPARLGNSRYRRSRLLSFFLFC